MPRNNKNWTVEEEKLLRDLLARGVHRSAIAVKLGRTEAAIEARASTIKHRAELAAQMKASLNPPENES
jgi:DNA-binding NarL/FixJ family response regulator